MSHSSCRIPNTFDIRPPQAKQSDEMTDELLIKWGDTPTGSLAALYLPALSATEILKWAGKMYSTTPLKYVDEHTVQCKCQTGGATYVPIPPGSQVNITGLLTVDLLPPLTKGQVFKIVVRQVRSVSGNYFVPPSNSPRTAKLTAFEPKCAIIPSYRRVLGAYQITIHISSNNKLLESEERNLSILRYILKGMSPNDRWFLVFSRYVDQIAERVQGFGGDPARIGPSSSGDWQKQKPGEGPGHKHEPDHEHEARIFFTGKIEGICYDRFGDFEGFLLDTEEGKRRFENREREVEELVHRAWMDRIVMTVVIEKDKPHRPISIILRGMPPKTCR
jgi:hypothetical protein